MMNLDEGVKVVKIAKVRARVEDSSGKTVDMVESSEEGSEETSEEISGETSGETEEGSDAFGAHLNETETSETEDE